ncbi:Secretory carrier-associated membrane protein 1 [Frankliniella fusca]|uniref:Secretory carrier-associated membrane protein 1 n=1 Tax=Frankliniella fusca TaxID=407009 RepID=A0AAE1HCK6_9NEOP|nr:Secretory carrier-associated membrane protein 1 [Frankliniella fusca]
MASYEDFKFSKSSGANSGRELLCQWNESDLKCAHPPQCKHRKVLHAAEQTLANLLLENAELRRKAARFDRLQREKAHLKAQIKAL